MTNMIKRGNSDEEMIAHDIELNDLRRERWVSNVVRGKFPLRAVLNKKYREKIENRIIDMYIDGSLTKPGLIALVEHQLILMKLGQRKIDTIPEAIRPLIQRMIDAGVQADVNKGLIDFDEMLLNEGVN